MLLFILDIFLLGSASNDVKRRGLYADFGGYINSEVTHNNLVHGGYWVMPLTWGLGHIVSEAWLILLLARPQYCLPVGISMAI